MKFRLCKVKLRRQRLNGPLKLTLGQFGYIWQDDRKTHDAPPHVLCEGAGLIQPKVVELRKVPLFRVFNRHYPVNSR